MFWIFWKLWDYPEHSSKNCALKRYFLSFDSSHVVWPIATLNFMPLRQEIQHKYSQTFPTSFSFWPSTNIVAATLQGSNILMNFGRLFFTACQSYDAMISMRKSMEQHICKCEVCSFLLEPEAMSNGGNKDDGIQKYENSELWGDLSALRPGEAVSERAKNQMLDTHKCFLELMSVFWGFASFPRNINDIFPKCETNGFLCQTKISGKSMSLFWSLPQHYIHWSPNEKIVCI